MPGRMDGFAGGSIWTRPDEVDARRVAAEADRLLPPSMRSAARQAIHGWAGYRPTPLRARPDLARRFGIGELWCKDEGARFGLGSFKALGGAYAVDLAADADPSATVASATEGNHGMSVAWGASRRGLGCVIYLHENVAASREREIAALGAKIRRVPGNYDDAVRACAREAEQAGWTVVSDTSWPGYEEIPRQVMAGYTVMTREIIAELGGEAPTHVFLQGGVGGLAAAAIADLCGDFPPSVTRYVLVEPLRAACLAESLAAGHVMSVAGPLDTAMAGLACGEPSALAIPVIAAGVFAALALEDGLAVEAAGCLAEGSDGNSAISAGLSGAAGLAGLLAVRRETEIAETLGLDGNSRILVVVTEKAAEADI